MINRYRLTSTVYEREDEAQKIFPEKRIFLSVEGNATEKEYFVGVSKNREKPVRKTDESMKIQQILSLIHI